MSQWNETVRLWRKENLLDVVDFVSIISLYQLHAARKALLTLHAVLFTTSRRIEVPIGHHTDSTQHVLPADIPSRNQHDSFLFSYECVRRLRPRVLPSGRWDSTLRSSGSSLLLSTWWTRTWLYPAISNNPSHCRLIGLPLEIVWPRIFMLLIGTKRADIARRAVHQTMADHLVLALEAFPPNTTRAAGNRAEVWSFLGMNICMRAY